MQFCIDKSKRRSPVIHPGTSCNITLDVLIPVKLWDCGYIYDRSWEGLALYALVQGFYLFELLINDLIIIPYRNEICTQLPLRS